jgi:hypothetical protein
MSWRASEMSGIGTFLEEVLKLRMNVEKSAVARPWKRKFLGFSVTAHRESRLRIAPASVQRLMQKVREVMRTGRGHSLARTIRDLNPLLRGWINYFRLTDSKGSLEELDGWLRRRLRCLLWRQWKRPATRARNYAPWDWMLNVLASAPAMAMGRGGTLVRPT